MIDHRGHEVPLCPSTAVPSSAPRTARRAVEQATMGSRRYAISYAMGSGVGVVIVAAVVIAMRISLHDKWPIIVGAIAATMLLGFAGIFSAAIGRTGRQEHAIRAMLSAGLCPSCAYDIAKGAVERDDCTVCPECGAAWRVPAPTSSSGSASS